MGIESLIPDAKQLLALEPEELANILLQYLIALPEAERGVSRYNYSLPGFVEGYPAEYRDDISAALMEAWSWLEREGMLVQKPGSQGFLILSRRARRMKTAGDVQDYRQATLVPKQLLHPDLRTTVWASFIRSEYDTAVFQAFKEVEVAVRDAAKLTAEDYGTGLMRKAFAPEKGPLADKTAPKAEQEAVLSLFAGAIGIFKNPHSHRKKVLDEPEEAAEMLFVASHLLRIVDARR